MSKKLFNAIKDYYNILDDLARRLQDNYNNGKPFEQQEEDRLAICGILDLFEEVETERPKNTILMKDWDTEEVDYIIRTSESTETIQQAINDAKEIYYTEDNKILEVMSVHCETDFVILYLEDNFDCEIEQYDTRQDVVYY